MLETTVAQLWIIGGTIITAILGWVGYSIKANIDLKKEIKKTQMEAQIAKAEEEKPMTKKDFEAFSKNVDTMLLKIDNLMENDMNLYHSQKDLSHKIDILTIANENQDAKLDRLSEGVIIALDTCMENGSNIMNNSDNVSKNLEKQFDKIMNFEDSLKRKGF